MAISSRSHQWNNRTQLTGKVLRVSKRYKIDDFFTQNKIFRNLQSMQNQFIRWFAVCLNLTVRLKFAKSYQNIFFEPVHWLASIRNDDSFIMSQTVPTCTDPVDDDPTTTKKHVIVTDRLLIIPYYSPCI